MTGWLRITDDEIVDCHGPAATDPHCQFMVETLANGAAFFVLAIVAHSSIRQNCFEIQVFCRTGAICLCDPLRTDGINR